MVTREQFYTLLRGESVDSAETLSHAGELLESYPYCHSMLLLHARLSRGETAAKRRGLLRKIAARLPSALPLCDALGCHHVLSIQGSTACEDSPADTCATASFRVPTPRSDSAEAHLPSPLEEVPSRDGSQGVMLPDAPSEALSAVVRPENTVCVETRPPVVIDWDSLMEEEPFVAPSAQEELNLEGVLADSLATEVPGLSPSIFPFVNAVDELSQDDFEFVTTVLNPLYKAAMRGDGEGTQREAIDAYLDNLDALVDKLRSMAQDENYNTENAEDLSKGSAVLSPDIISERLAQVHVQRGEYSLAIAMYERLSAKNPEKSSYFAGVIEGLRARGGAPESL